MKKQYHILNGDSLKDRFPESIQGEIIVARECMVDGDVTGNTLKEIFANRAQFMAATYEGCTIQEYHNKTITEFEKMFQIDADAEINLWFEDDLFCQVNLWFVLHLLRESNKTNSLFLIRPLHHSPYSFGNHNAEELDSIYENRIALNDMEKLTQFWRFYQNNDSEELLQISEGLDSKYPFLLPAARAYIDSIPTENDQGRPTESLIKIMKGLKTDKFGPIFMEFCKREAIYGFGDLQVKQLFDKILKEKN